MKSGVALLRLVGLCLWACTRPDFRACLALGSAWHTTRSL